MNEYYDFLNSLKNTADPRLNDFIKGLGFETHNLIYEGPDTAFTKVDGLNMSFFVKDEFAAFTVFDTSYKILDRATFMWENNEWRECNE